MIANILSFISSALAFIPGFLCGVCEALSFTFGILSAGADFFAHYYRTAVQELVLTIGAVVLGRIMSGGLDEIIEKDLGKSVRYIARHRKQAEKVLRYTPSKFRAYGEYIMNSFLGSVSLAISIGTVN